MLLATQRVTRSSIDLKRVAAGSGVMLLHLIVIGMLLLPGKPMTLPTLRPQHPEVSLEWTKPPEPPPLPPPPIAVPPPPANLQVVAPPPVVVPTQPMAPVTTTTEIVHSTTTELPVLPRGEFESGSTTTVGLGSGVLVTLKTLRAPPPAYPRRELARGIEGEVVLRVLVNEAGFAQTIEVIGGTRNRNLEIAATNAVKRWRFQPHTVDGVAQPAWARVPMVFRIDD